MADKFVVRGNATFALDGAEEVFFADFAIKLVGEVHNVLPRMQKGDNEGKWMAAVSGYIFGERASKLVIALYFVMKIVVNHNNS